MTLRAHVTATYFLPVMVMFLPAMVILNELLNELIDRRTRWTLRAALDKKLSRES